MSYRTDLVAGGVILVVPWLLFGGGIVGLVSVLWVWRVGPVPVDYSRAFAFYDRLSSPRLAKLVLQFYLHGFWLLQALHLLVDVYPTASRCHRTQDERRVKQPHAR